MLKTRTSCKECCFLRDEKCELGRHEQFQKNNGVLSTEDGFPVIENRFCAAFRNNEWAERNVDKEIAVRHEILIRSHIFIYTPDWNLTNINKTLKSLKKQLLAPSGISFIGTRQNFTSKVIPKLSQHGNIVSCIDPSYGPYQCLDAAIESCKSYFYLLVLAGSKIPSDFLANIDEKINDKLEQFVAIEGNGEILFGASIDIHSKYHGSLDCIFVEEEKERRFISHTLLDKIKHFAKIHNEFSYIKNYEEFL